MSKLIIISNRLPVSIQKKNSEYITTRSSGGLATGLSTVFKNSENIWIGWPGASYRDEESREEITAKLGKKNMIPVFIPQDLFNKYYTGFSNNTLWPLFHYFPKLTEISEETWDAYQKVNALFAEEVLKHAQDGDTIWIHDYHLFLLPAMIRNKLPHVRMGFFLHIPFPSYEIFRILPRRVELMEGILGADLIGFHTYDDMRHFLSASSRILGISHINGHLTINNRLIKVDSFPMGIDYEQFASLTHNPVVINKIKDLRKKMGNLRLIISVDRLDLSKGIPEKIKSFEYFIEKHPEYQMICTLILLVVPSRTEVPVYKELKKEIEQEVGRINGRFGRIDWTPILYLYRGVTNETLSAFYVMSEVAMVTPLRDGMNLVSKEYVASNQDGKGVLILSEFAGASKELNDALIVNPYNIQEVSDAIRGALEMPEKEQRERNESMQKRVSRYDVHFWANIFLETLEKLIKSRYQIPKLALELHERSKLENQFHTSENRLLFLDYDGTLRPFTLNPEDAKPSEELLEVLKKLVANKNNCVVIISGRGRFVLEEWLGETGAELIAEHGVWVKRSGEEWKRNESAENEWKKDFRHLFEEFTDRTPGTLIEEKEFSLVWHYRKADPDFANMRARELENILSYMTANRNLYVMEGNKIIELKHAAVNKGVAASLWLMAGEYDFILAAGDDRTDEDLFKALPNEAWKIKIGHGKDTTADYTLKSAEEMIQLLKSLSV